MISQVPTWHALEISVIVIPTANPRPNVRRPPPAFSRYERTQTHDEGCLPRATIGSRGISPVPVKGIYLRSASLAVQRLQLRIHQKRVVKLRHFAPALAQHRQQPRRERLMPLHRQAGHIADDEGKLLR